MDLPAWIPHSLILLAADFLRLCVWLVLLSVVFCPLEKIFALQRRKIFRRAFFADLGYYFLTGLSTSRFLILPMAGIAWALHFVIPAGLQAHVAAMPFGLRFGLSLVVGELGFYWGHRWSHEIPFLWRFHAVHHSAEEMDWLVNTRAHPVDLVFTRMCGLIPMYVLGLSQPGGSGGNLVPLLVILTTTVWGFFIHANVNWRLGPLGWLVSTPVFHHWHHTYGQPLNRNFAPMLPWIDRLFGTYYVPKAQWPSRYGTETPVGSGLAKQLVLPLMPVDRELVASDQGESIAQGL